jgi:hypothetical protein
LKFSRDPEWDRLPASRQAQGEARRALIGSNRVEHQAADRAGIAQGDLGVSAVATDYFRCRLYRGPGEKNPALRVGTVNIDLDVHVRGNSHAQTANASSSQKAAEE